MKSLKLLQGSLGRGPPSCSPPRPQGTSGAYRGSAVCCLCIPHPGLFWTQPALHGSIWAANPRHSSLRPHRLLSPSGVTPESSSRAPSLGTPLTLEDSHGFLIPSPGNLCSEVLGADESLALKNLRRHKSGRNLRALSLFHPKTMS